MGKKNIDCPDPTVNIPVPVWVGRHAAKIVITGGFFVATSLLVTFVNLWFTSHLAPLVEADSILQRRVDAIDKLHEARADESERLVIIEQKLIPMREDISEIKKDIKDIKNSLIP